MAWLTSISQTDHVGYPNGPIISLESALPASARAGDQSPYLLDHIILTGPELRCDSLALPLAPVLTHLEFPSEPGDLNLKAYHPSHHVCHIFLGQRIQPPRFGKLALVLLHERSQMAVQRFTVFYQSRTAVRLNGCIIPGRHAQRILIP